eukprot:15261154-Alexandrium_andersonii.AAC.1
MLLPLPCSHCRWRPLPPEKAGAPVPLLRVLRLPLPLAAVQRLDAAQLWLLHPPALRSRAAPAR